LDIKNREYHQQQQYFNSSNKSVAATYQNQQLFEDGYIHSRSSDGLISLLKVVEIAKIIGNNLGPIFGKN